MKGKLRITLSLALALLLALCLLTACGDTGSDKASDSGGDLADDNGVVGLWESEEWGGICLELLDDGTGTIYTYSDMGDITYSWDGEVLTLMNENEDGELEEVTGELQKDGSIGIMGGGAVLRPRHGRQQFHGGWRHGERAGGRLDSHQRQPHADL